MMRAPALGQSLNLVRSLTQTDFDRFARISGDDNPIHVNPAFSARSNFGRTVSHGMLLYSVLWGMVAAAFGPLRQSAQNLMFPAPSYADEPLDFTATVTALDHDTITFVMQVRRVADGVVTCDGQASYAFHGSTS